MSGKQTDLFKLDDTSATELANCLRAMGEALLHAKNRCEDTLHQNVDRSNWNTDAYDTFDNGPLKSFSDWCWSGYQALNNIASKIERHGDIHRTADRTFGNTAGTEF